MLHRLSSVLVVAALVIPPAVTQAGTGSLTYTFATVDGVKVIDKLIYVTGIQVGASTPTEIPASFADSSAAERCDRLALIAMSKPGKYQFSILNPSSGTYYCDLSVVTP